MAKKLETVKLIASLEKASRKTKKAIWADLAERLGARSRSKKEVNLDEIETLAKKFKGKTLIVPGKVLARGTLTEKVNVVAVAASSEAKAKIDAKGKFTKLSDFAENAEKVKVNELIILG
jgi:large subunit ribosomal protein L18e